MAAWCEERPIKAVQTLPLAAHSLTPEQHKGTQDKSAKRQDLPTRRILDFQTLTHLLAAHAAADVDSHHPLSRPIGSMNRRSHAATAVQFRSYSRLHLLNRCQELCALYHCNHQSMPCDGSVELR